MASLGRVTTSDLNVSSNWGQFIKIFVMIKRSFQPMEVMRGMNDLVGIDPLEGTNDDENFEDGILKN